jgi:putative FmdB family regulatory protein
MPLYEYECEQDGTVIEVQRTMSEADKPFEDPEGKGRVFKRKISTFMAKGAPAATSLPTCCPCGKPGGGCSVN